MGTWGYRNLRMKYHPKQIDSEKELPPGEWLTVDEASERTGYSAMAIRLKAMRGEIKSVKIRKHLRVSV